MYKITSSLIIILILAGCKDAAKKVSASSAISYPATMRDTSAGDVYFGVKVADPYRWMENDTSLATKDWVLAENKVTNNYLSKIPFREEIRNRITSLYNYEKYTSPFRVGNYIYFYKNSGLQNQSVLYRQREGSSEIELFLDPNSFSLTGTTSLSDIEFTEDGALAAYQISEGGSDWRKLIVMDAVTKAQVGDTLHDVKFSGISWRGKEGFYYSSYDKPREGSQLSGKTQYHKLYYHKLNTPQSSDRLVFGGTNQPHRYINGDVTENQHWLVITAANSTYGNELFIQDLTKPAAPIITLVDNDKFSNNFIDADDTRFYFQSDQDAPNGKVMVTEISKPKRENWKDLIGEQAEVLSASTACGYIFCTYLKDATSYVVQYDYAGNKVREINLPGPGSANGFNAKRKDKDLFYVFTSYTYPSTIFKLDPGLGAATVYKRSGAQFNPDDYESKQVFYASKDGTKIPMIITYKKGMKRDGKNVTLLYAYGGFSISLTPYFSTARILLLENGGVFAVPNLRGGGEYGEKWHEAGIKTKKQNVFDDFKSAAKYLVDSGYTSRDHLSIEGGSNGGLLIGACITQEPNISKVAFPEVGVMDMLRYNKFTAGAGWAYDYGTAEDSKEMFQYLKGYSPLHNIKEAEYPATLVTTADHDDRVVPAHSFKFAATLQANQKGSNPVLIRVETKAGHGAGMSTQQIIDELTDKYSFMYYNMGITPDLRKTKLN